MNDRDDKKVQILLVEDSLSDAILLRSLLEKDESIRVTLAQDGIRGCQQVEHQKWDMVITDLNLPGRDGIEVIQTCKLHQPDTPVLATSAYSAPIYEEGAYRSGANEFLVKPVHGSDLIDTVRDLLAVSARARAVARRRVILAIGTFPGDVEAGCGGILLKHSAAGDDVHLLVITAGAGGAEGAHRMAAAKRAAQVLGVHLLAPDWSVPDLPDLDYMVIRVQDAVHELEPDLVFAPSGNDVRESRQHAFKATGIAGSKVPGLYCYQAATSTLEFRPTVFEDLSEYLDQKVGALALYEGHTRGRPHLDPDRARASARYWGRFLGYGEVEPLEVVRHSL
jgi:CheY-like chemotaxis protein